MYSSNCQVEAKKWIRGRYEYGQKIIIAKDLRKNILLDRAKCKTNHES
jgi:hypothetical protein